MQIKQKVKTNIPEWLEGLPKSWDSNISVLCKNNLSAQSGRQTRKCPSGFIYVDMEQNQIQLHRTSKSPRKDKYFIHKIDLINMENIVYICAKDSRIGKTDYFFPDKTARRL